MPDEIELNGEMYKRFGGEWHDANFIRVPQAIARELDVKARRAEEAAVVTAPVEAPAETVKTAKSHGGTTESAFSEEEVAPIIAEVIRERFAESGDYVKHRKLVEALLERPEAREQIESAVEKRGHTEKQWASWMVQSFSAAMTAERLPIEDAFERERIDNQWAYRPVDG